MPEASDPLRTTVCPFTLRFGRRELEADFRKSLHSSWQHLDLFADCAGVLLGLFYTRKLCEPGPGMFVPLYFAAARAYTIGLRLLGPRFGLDYGDWRGVAMGLGRLHKGAASAFSFARRFFWQGSFTCTLLQMELWDLCISLFTDVVAGHATLFFHHVPLHAITVLVALLLTLSSQGTCHWLENPPDTLPDLEVCAAALGQGQRLYSVLQQCLGVHGTGFELHLLLRAIHPELVPPPMEPLQACYVTGAFGVIVVGALLPTAACYCMERRDCLKFLAGSRVRAEHDPPGQSTMLIYVLMVVLVVWQAVNYAIMPHPPAYW